MNEFGLIFDNGMWIVMQKDYGERAREYSLEDAIRAAYYYAGAPVMIKLVVGD